MKRILLLLAITFLLIGCNSVYKENIEAADSTMENGDYEDALLYYNTALEEKPDDLDVKAKIALLTEYENLQEYLADYKWSEATDSANNILKSNAIIPSLEKEVKDSIKGIKEEQEIEKIIVKEFKDIEKSIDNNEIEKVNSKLAELKNDVKSDFLKNGVDNLYTKLEKAEERIAKEESEKEAEKIRLKEKEQANKTQFKKDYLAKFDEFERQAQEDIEISFSEDMSATFHETIDIIEIKTDQWDSYLNDVYQVLKEDMSDSEFANLKEKQNAWLENKDDLLDDASTGGTASSEVKAWIEYDETRDRSYYLVENYFD